jgi:hypothetical protein
MIVHVLRFRFKDGTTEEDTAACLESLRAVGRMDSVLHAAIGDHFTRGTDRHTHSAAYTLADINAFEQYNGDPVHRQADFIVHPHVTNFDVFDIADEDDPDLWSKIAAIQQSRIVSDPELAKLIDLAPEK